MTTTVPIMQPPPDNEAELLAMYLEGVPVVQIARALQVPVADVLAFLESEGSRRCIHQFESALATQTRLYALASRIPAMAVLREVCVTEGPIAERRRAATELLREHRASKKKTTSRAVQPAPAAARPSASSTLPAVDPEPALHAEAELNIPAAGKLHSSVEADGISPDHRFASTPPANVPPDRLPPPPSPFDIIGGPQISEPLPDAVPVAA